MADWVHNLTQGQRMLLTAVSQKLSGVELAVMAVMVALPDYRVPRVSWLWDCVYFSQSPSPLPYTRQGIEKAVKRLEERGWLERVTREGRTVLFKDPPVRLLPLNILSEAPRQLRPAACVATPVEAPASQRELGSDRQPTTVAKRSKRNGSSKRPRATTVAPELICGDPPRTVTVKIKCTSRLGEPSYHCQCEGGEGPEAWYSTRNNSMPGAAREYAAKVMTRLHDRAIQEHDLRPNHLGKGRYQYTLKDAKGGRP